MNSKAAARDGWVRVQFGDVVRLVRDRVDPETSGLTRYVAGEHMDTDDLRIRRWGKIGDGYLGPAFHMRFKPGHVLYGSRRTYLRKVALADFEGICANTTFVLESTDASVLLPGLLPYVMQTDTFHEHSVKQSKGSVNPYVNFSDLAWYEFHLPPIEEQLRQVARLDAIRNVREACTLAVNAGARVRASLAHFCETESCGYPALSIGELVEEMQYGVSCRPETSGSIPLLRMGNLRDGILDTADLRYTEASEINCGRDLLNTGDVLFNRTNSLDLVGKAALFDLEGSWAFASYLVRLVPRIAVVMPEFLVAIINSAPVRARILANATKGVSQANVNTTNLANVKARIPPLAMQQQIVEALRQVRHSEARLLERANRTPTKGTLLELETT